MVGELRDVVEKLEVPLDGDALAEVLKVADLLNAKLAAAVGEFDAEALWELDGATSMTAWLRHHAGMTASTAKTVASTAKKLRTLPMTAACWLSGSLTGGQVQAIVRNATPSSRNTKRRSCPRWSTYRWPTPRWPCSSGRRCSTSSRSSRGASTCRRPWTANGN